ncbi:Golgi transport complex subunit 1 [Mortierella antarctica]|nr:Golgi transport complex subunit 1 [Mortierella antarctica]
MTMLATDAKAPPPVADADDLFMRLSVPELNAYERRTRTDIENKKQELRIMVGERYRDLIGAADCIVRMKETAFAVQDNISKMRNSCDIHALKRNVAAKTKKAQSGSMDEMKKSLYTSAAQIKLLADVPEQIWRNMESSSYLTASRLYLISKAIYNKLNAGTEGDATSVKVMETFPVVGRQWDAVSHFKAQILQKSTTHLKSAKETDLDVIETICAIMLLDDVTMKDMFRLLLAQRQAAIRDVLEVKGGDDIGQQIVQAIQIFRATLFHVGKVFIEPEQGSVSPLERHLRSLQQTFAPPLVSIPSTTSKREELASAVLQPSALNAPVVPKLYPTTPNIHLLVRYLPDSIQNFTPFIHLDGNRATFSQQHVYQGIQHWKNDIVTMFSAALEKLLQQVQTNTALVAIRAKVWQELQADEYTVESKSKNPWNQICKQLLGDYLSIWNTILRAGFARTFQDIIDFSLGELSMQPQKLLRARLGEVDQDNDPNRDIGRFIWNESTAGNKGTTTNAAAVATSSTGSGNATSAALSSLPSATEPLIEKIREYVAGRTDLVAIAVDAFEGALGAIRLDQEPALDYQKDAVFGQLLDTLSSPVSREHDDTTGEVKEKHLDNMDLFSARADAAQLVEYYQKQFVGCIKAYTHELENLVQEAVRKPEKARNTLPAMDRSMTVGRVASGVGSLGSVIHKALLPPLRRGSKGTLSCSGSVSSFAQERAAKAQVDTQVQELVKGLFGVYLISHAAWIDSVEHSLKRSLKVYLEQSSWADLAALAWEPIPSSSASSSVSSSIRGSPMSSPMVSGSAPKPNIAQEDTKTLLPFHGSTRLMTALHQVVQEMHRVGTGFMRPELVRQLTAKLAVATFKAVDWFLNEMIVLDGEEEEAKENKVMLTEKGAMQLLFDLKFLNLVFQTHLEDAEFARLSKSVTDLARTHIDPINLAVFEKPLEANADRQYGRVGALLGLLVQLNPVESKRKTNVVEKSPHVFAMAPLTARFTLLPIGQKMTSGRVV